MPEEKAAEEETYFVSALLPYSQQIFGQPSFVVEGAIERSGLSGQLVTKTRLAREIASFLAQKDPRHVGD